MEELVGSVASVLSECAQYSTNLDRLCFLLRGVSSEIGSLLDEILVTRQRNVESGELIKLQELNTCVGELCVQYETNLFRSFTQLSGSVIGRPRKAINIPMLCIFVESEFHFQ